MSKLFISIISAVLIIFISTIALSKISQPQEALVGTQQPDQGQKHVQQNQKHDDYNSSPASSGPHYADASAPTNWGIYEKEVPAEIYLHNEEHGGVVITYKPELLTTEDLSKLRTLLVPKSKDAAFQPSRFILTPSANNTRAIQIASWRWTLSLDKYDEQSIVKFYKQHVNKSPEAGAAPTNIPIDMSV